MLELSGIGVVTAFAAGAISFLSPCVLPVVPAYISYVAGESYERRGDASANARIVGLSLLFVLGFSTVFVLLGAGATAAGSVLLAYRYEANIVAGLIVIGFGLFMLGMARPAWVLRDLRFQPNLEGGRPIAAYVLGLAFAFGWTPCIGPVLGAILTVNAMSAEIGNGMALLAIYSAGLGVPFLAVAAFTDQLAGRLTSLRRLGGTLYAIAGVVMVAMGIAMVTDQLSVFAFWLLETFPILSRIG